MTISIRKSCRAITTAKSLLMLFLLLFASCDNSEERYSNEYLCQFTFNTQLHIASPLTRCLTNPGSFVRVDVKKEKGVFNLYIYSNNGEEQEKLTLATDRENYQMGQVGANNSIIVGCSNFNGLKAYDAQCPNCLDTYTGTNYPLTWGDNGQTVNCAKCKRSYQLNTEGITNDGLRLIEYRIRFDGKMLTVRNI